ncbi:MAG: hypothetical protein ACE5EO_06455 [Candidatus Krumholzibacteriia bacterium]
MKPLRMHVLALVLLVFGQSPARAGFGAGGSFSAPGYGARAWGMAGAAVAVGADESASFWNPALLALLDRDRLGLSYIDLVPGTDARQSYVAYARILKPGTVEEPGLEFARHAAGLVYGNLSLELSDGRTHTENTVRLAYAFAPQHFVSVGVAFSVLFSSSDVTQFGSLGTALDAGFRIALLENVTAAAVIRSAFSEISFDDGISFQLPRFFTLGVAYTGYRGLTLEGDVVTGFGGVSRTVIGGEYGLFSDVLSLRGGLAAIQAGRSRSVPHFGLGVRIGRLRLDYNANLDDEDAFGDTHRFALGVGL